MRLLLMDHPVLYVVTRRQGNAHRCEDEDQAFRAMNIETPEGVDQPPAEKRAQSGPKSSPQRPAASKVGPMTPKCLY